MLQRAYTHIEVCFTDELGLIVTHANYKLRFITCYWCYYFYDTILFITHLINHCLQRLSMGLLCPLNDLVTEHLTDILYTLL